MALGSGKQREGIVNLEVRNKMMSRYEEMEVESLERARCVCKLADWSNNRKLFRTEQESLFMAKRILVGEVDATIESGDV